MAEDNKYEVVVSNVGTVHTGNRKDKAMATYWDYVSLSRHGLGKCSNEQVTLFMNGDIVAEHIPEEE